MDKKENHKQNEELSKDLNDLDQYRELEIDLNRNRNHEEFAEDLEIYRNQIIHNRES
ncbi:hypothetical protein [Lysinibacillus yapensis]|uniref:hypothetical protein n=1 Tax=Ureibacillus yapensis TaxID=2304605 RepID=UPI001314C48E|nr:hypothetical protein [Lysinibacillus yapensis]